MAFPRQSAVNQRWNRLAWLGRQGERFRMAIFGFFDDSGKWRQHNIVLLCGYLGSEKDWSEFERRWRDRLGNRKAIHATQLLQKRGEPETGALVSDCIDIIRDEIPCGIVVGLDAVHYRRLTDNQRNRIGAAPLICLSQVLRLAVEKMQEWRTDQYGSLHLTFDDSDEDAENMLRTWLRLRKVRQELRNIVGSIGFANDEIACPLQAADLLANLALKYNAEHPEASIIDYVGTLMTTADGSARLDYRQNLIDATAINEAVLRGRKLY